MIDIENIVRMVIEGAISMEYRVYFLPQLEFYLKAIGTSEHVWRARHKKRGKQLYNAFRKFKVTVARRGNTFYSWQITFPEVRALLNVDVMKAGNILLPNIWWDIPKPHIIKAKNRKYLTFKLHPENVWVKTKEVHWEPTDHFRMIELKSKLNNLAEEFKRRIMERILNDLTELIKSVRLTNG